jgi:exonuclease III
MVRILSWNCRGFNKSKKRNLLSEYLTEHKIDIVGLQKTNIEVFSDRILNKLSNKIMFWLSKSSQGNSGGILLGVNDSLYIIINH